MKNKDLFDELSDEMADPFADIESTEDLAINEIKSSISDLFKKIELKEKRNNQAISDIKELIKNEISKIKPVQNIIERQVEQVHKYENVVHHVSDIPKPQQIIREVRVEIPKKETKVYVEESVVSELKKEIKELREDLEETSRIARSPMVIPSIGGSGVIGIPPPEPETEGHVLTVKTQGGQKKALWQAASGSGGLTAGTYSVSNANDLRTFDVNNTSIDELARILGALISDLGGL